MKIGLVGPSYQQRSLPFDAQRTVNLYPVFDENGKEVASLYGTPGLTLFTSAGTGPIRAIYTAANGRCFYVSGLEFYEVDQAGVSTLRGTLTGSATSICSFAENGLQIAVCNGSSAWIMTYSSNAFAQITDVDFPSSGTIAFLDGYFIVNKINSGQFNISALYDGFTWDALDFATAESSPDTLLRVLNAVGQLWLFGYKTTEIWSNTGDSVFPFQRIAGAKMEMGIIAPHSAVAVDNSVIWVGRDDIGSGSVYRASGFTPTRISTDAIDKIIQGAANQDQIRAYTYQQEGHVFYVLTGDGLPTTLVYDITTGLWHERASLDSDGLFTQHIGGCGSFAFNYTLIGDRSGGNLYKMSLDVYSDNGDEIVRERTYTHLSDEGKKIRFNTLEIGVETGVGLQTGQGADPLISLQLSKDGARTWSSEYTAQIGAVGAYKTNVRFRRLGVAENMTFRIRITDPVKVAITGSYLS